MSHIIVKGPSPIITFQGIQINTLAMEFHLPCEKIDHIAGMMADCRACIPKGLKIARPFISHDASVV